MKNPELRKQSKTTRFKFNTETHVFEQELPARRDGEKKEVSRFLKPNFNPNYLDLGEGLGHAGTFEMYTKEGQLAAYLDMIVINNSSIQNQKPAILAYMSVRPSLRNQHYGNSLLTAFNELLDKTNAFGILQNIIPKMDPAHDIYKKANWRQVDDTNIFTYNLHSSASTEQLRGILASQAALVYMHKTLVSSMTRFN